LEDQKANGYANVATRKLWNVYMKKNRMFCGALLVRKKRYVVIGNAPDMWRITMRMRWDYER